MRGYEIYTVHGGNDADLVVSYGTGGIDAFKSLAKEHEMSEFTMVMLVSVFSSDDDHDWHIQAVAYEGKITWLADGRQE